MSGFVTSDVKSGFDTRHVKSQGGYVIEPAQDCCPTEAGHCAGQAADRRSEGMKRGDELVRSSEAKLWLPPEKVWRYEWFKVGAGGLVCVMFAGWLVLQWSNPVMRWVSVALIGTTCWVVVGTLLDDLRRGRGRQVTLDHGSLRVDGPNGRQEIRLDEVAFASWREDDQAGLWFYDKQHRATVYLDGGFLADQAEAREFLGWLRGSERLSFEVRWPVGGV